RGRAPVAGGQDPPAGAGPPAAAAPGREPAAGQRRNPCGPSGGVPVLCGHVPGLVRGCAVNRYCVGPAMAVDWGEDQPELGPADRRRMMARVLSYFRPYWRPGLVVGACIPVPPAPGPAPPLVFTP